MKLILSPRRRRISLRVTPEGEIEILAPAGFTEEEAQALLLRHSRLVDRLKQRAEVLKRKRPVLEEGVPLLCLGREYPLFTSRRLVQFDGERFMIPPGSGAERLGMLEKIYRSLAVKFIVPRAAALAEKFGISIAGVRINGAVTRWGSCSAQGNLNFSWHLMRCPEELVDSVICHELAHRIELNHSPAFYRQLSRLDPLYAEHRTALRRFTRTHPWFGQA
ncbi:MAG: M48 family metallopeptidase [Lentisphaeria bacterium]|nr:M48 family metallopeptidase [Lentisphaeria bacterium]